MADQGPTFRGLVAAFTDFLTVAIHTILYERAIYPQTSFLSAKRYNHPVRQNRHPKVCEWVNDAVNAVETELQKGGVDRVAVVIFSRDNAALERFVFDVSQFPSVPTSDLDTPLERSGESGEKVEVLPTVDTEEQLRATMSQLVNCGARLKALPERCTFSVAIELKQDGQAPLSHPQPWIPAQPDRSKRQGESTASHQDSVRTVPVRTVQAGEMIFEAWIEQSHDV